MSDHLFAQADAVRLPLPDNSVDLVVGSPPYLEARLYLEDGVELGIARGIDAWVAWMLDVTVEALRVTRGAVIWVCAGSTNDRNYQPGPEGLLWEASRRGILTECPVYWHRYGISGSGGSQWFRKDVEYCLCFKRSKVFPWSDNTACGRPPKYGPGGEMSHRLTNGERRNQWGGSKTSGACRGKAGGRMKAGRPSHEVVVKKLRQPDGRLEAQGYVPPAIANPGNLLDTGAAGGGSMGHPLAHQNEAPYPEAIPEFFIKSLCDVGGIVLDPFSGSGTTVATAERLGRRGIGFDLRLSQCRLGRRRLERPHAPVAKARTADEAMPLFGATS